MRLGTSLAGYWLSLRQIYQEGSPHMTQAIVGTLLLRLAGLMWVIVLDILGRNRPAHANKQENVSLDT